MQDDNKGKDKRLAVSWNELGNAYIMNQMWEMGEGIFLQSRRTLQDLADFTRVLMSLRLVNLGLAYWLMGRSQLRETRSVRATAL